MKYSTTFYASLTTFTISLAAPLAPGIYDFGITRRDPVDSSSFAADSSINAVAIYNAAKSATQKPLASYLTDSDSTTEVSIYGDWQDLDGVKAFHFIADMDIDCDGDGYKCEGATTSDPDTSFGHLDTNQVPYFVIPATFTDNQKDMVKPNAVGAIICGGKMFYGIFGDTNGATPQVIGEASLLLARACFPDANISGSLGHGPADVAYIVFGNEVPTGVEDKTIDIAALKTLGDQQAMLLQKALAIEGDTSGGSDPAPSGTDATTSPSSSPTASLDGAITGVIKGQ